MSYQPEYEIQQTLTPEEVRQHALAELDATSQAIAELSDEQIAELSDEQLEQVAGGALPPGTVLKAIHIGSVRIPVTLKGKAANVAYKLGLTRFDVNLMSGK